MFSEYEDQFRSAPFSVFKQPKELYIPPSLPNIKQSIYHQVELIMRCLRHHSVKQFTILLLFLCSAYTSTQAADIQAIAGYTLGSVLEKQQVLNETKANDGTSVYSVKPLGSLQQVAMLTVRITQQQQIHRISAFSPVLSAADCQTRMMQLRKQTEKQFPKLGYYAMDKSELFYEDDRTYTLECINTDDGIRLRQEFTDDKLAAH